MTSIEEVRGGIAAADSSAQTALGLTQQAISELESSRGALMSAVEGSGQADAEQAVGMWSQALESLNEALQRILAGSSLANDVAARL